MYTLLLVAVVLLIIGLKARETFVVKYGNPFNDEDIISFDANAKGKRLFATWPDSCPADRPEYDAGLCYQDCEVGYHGVGPQCWADTKDIGIGKVLELMNCSESGYPGWTDTGLLCHEPIQCGKGWEFFTKGCWGGRVNPKKLTCDKYPEHKDMISALCYRRCPPDKPRHVPMMPYLCFKGGRGLAYGRGVGTIPPIYAVGE